MTNQVVAWSGLVASMVFVGLAIGISYWQQLRLERRIAVAVVRSLAQLMVVGVALVAVVKPSTQDVEVVTRQDGSTIYVIAVRRGGATSGRSTRSQNVQFQPAFASAGVVTWVRWPPKKDSPRAPLTIAW